MTKSDKLISPKYPLLTNVVKCGAQFYSHFVCLYNVEAEKCTFWTASARYLSAHAEMAEKCTFFGPFPHGISAHAEMAEKCTLLPHGSSLHAEMAVKCTFNWASSAHKQI